MQSKTQILIESTINVAIGYGVALAAQIAVFPMFGIRIAISDNILIGAIFTAISIARSYAVRRIFNHLHRSKS